MEELIAAVEVQAEIIAKLRREKAMLQGEIERLSAPKKAIDPEKAGEDGQ